MHLRSGARDTTWSMNAKKTKWMKIGRQREILNIKLSGRIMEQLNQFKCLGEYFTSNGPTERAARERLSLGQRVLGRRNRLWRYRTISVQWKERLHTTIVAPTALCGAECWKNEEKSCFEMECSRRKCGVRGFDRLTHERVRENSRSERNNCGLNKGYAEMVWPYIKNERRTVAECNTILKRRRRPA